MQEISLTMISRQDEGSMEKRIQDAIEQYMTVI